MKESMFCFQCQETAKGTGCTVRGVCGKNSTTSARMDLLLFVIRGISIAAHTLRTHRILPDPQVNAFVIDALFSLLPMLISTKKASPTDQSGVQSSQPSGCSGIVSRHHLSFGRRIDLERSPGSL